MASVLLAAGAGIYYKVKSTKAKHAAQRSAHNSTRFSALEQETAERELERTRRLSSVEPQPPTSASTQLASNNPFRDAPTRYSNADDPFRSSEDLAAEGERRGSSGGGVEGMRGRGYEAGVWVEKEKKKRRIWGRKTRVGGLRLGGKKEDGVVR